MAHTQKLDTIITPQVNSDLLAESVDNATPSAASAAHQAPEASPAKLEEAVAGVDIAGYELLEKLGCGGYGEVWKAIGPGGLPKAVKILFGEKSGQHAAVELKALQRMRELRHPFLLSIERIEIINNRLIVVTELADKNLSDEFDDCRRSGKLGIERDQLLSYMTDAADALDYMYEQHGLQHLDIKPDNILLQGDRAKVGDFGLAKDISRADVSMLNGFTPMYAAPELFEGNPGAGSDQYSMAMMYTMMLTGKLPFTGRTPAQLMSQHMKSPPDLSNLQPVDRPAVARALSKNPNARFDSIRAFVEELCRRKAARQTASLKAIAPLDDPKTELVHQAEGENIAGRDPKPSEPRSYTPPLKTNDSALRSSMFVGIGGLAAQALKQLKSRIQTDNGPAEDCDFPLLLIDSDRDSLNTAKMSGALPGLSTDETLHLPLKKSKDYKANKNLDLSWLSRRWLFNIPRTGRVDGIRPLGRLVLADHLDSVRKRLTELVVKASSDECMEAVSKHAELAITKDAIDIYVVASSTGGTSSGMVADIGLMLQAVARRKRLGDVKIHCVLLHGTGMIRTTADVQEANTLSLLTELRHLSTPGLGSPRGFQSDQHSLDDCPFDSCRMVPLGDGENDHTLSQRSEQVGNFLHDVATTAAQFDFQEWQNQQQLSTLGPGCLQLLGMDQQSSANLMTASAEANSLSTRLMNHWVEVARSVPEEADRILPTEETQLLMSSLNLTKDTLPDQIMSILQGETGQEVQECSDVLLKTICEQNNNQPMTQRQLLQSITTTGFQNSSATDSASIVGIVNEVSSILETARGHVQEKLSTHFRGFLDTSGRMATMQIAANVARQELAETLVVCSKLKERIEAAFAHLTSNASSETLLSDEEAVEQSRQYCTLLAWQLVYRCFTEHLESLKLFVQQQLESLHQLAEQLASKTDEPKEAASETIDQVGDEPQSADEEPSAEEGPQTNIEEFDRFLRSIDESFLATYFEGGTTSEVLQNRLSAKAQQFLMATTDHEEDVVPTGDHKQFPATAWPRTCGVGGVRRVLGLLPAELDGPEWKSKLHKEFGDCIGVRASPRHDLSIYCEINEVPFESLIQSLCFNRSHLQDVARRVHTRVDIDW